MALRIVLSLIAALLVGAGIALHETGGGFDLGVGLMFLGGFLASAAYGPLYKRRGNSASDKGREQ